MAKITLETEKCIGCGTCEALCKKYFELVDGKSHLKGSKPNSEGNQELETEDIDCLGDAVSSCPVQVIHLEK